MKLPRIGMASRSRRSRVVRVVDAAMILAASLWLASLCCWCNGVFNPGGRRILFVYFGSGSLSIEMETPLQPETVWQFPIRGRPSLLSRNISLVQQNPWGIRPWHEIVMLKPLAEGWGLPCHRYAEFAIPSMGCSNCPPPNSSNLAYSQLSLPLWCLVAGCAGLSCLSRVAFRRVADPAWCGRCGYDLRGLDGGRCPECGTSLKDVPAQCLMIPKA
jgi:hypothetical protein